MTSAAQSISVTAVPQDGYVFVKWRDVYKRQVWDTTDAPEEIPEDYEYKFIDFVNPEILAVSEEEAVSYTHLDVYKRQR